MLLKLLLALLLALLLSLLLALLLSLMVALLLSPLLALLSLQAVLRAENASIAWIADRKKSPPGF